MLVRNTKYPEKEIDDMIAKYSIQDHFISSEQGILFNRLVEFLFLTYACALDGNLNMNTKH